MRDSWRFRGSVILVYSILSKYTLLGKVLRMNLALNLGRGVVSFLGVWPFFVDKLKRGNEAGICGC